MIHPVRSLPLAWPFLTALLLAIAATPAARAADPAAQPIFDAHLHYNWEPVPHVPLEKVLALFREQKVIGILAASRPDDGTRALVEAKDLWVVPFIRPYRVRADIQTWMDEYRSWLAQLQPAVTKKIAFRNAERLFNKR